MLRISLLYFFVTSLLFVSPFGWSHEFEPTKVSAYAYSASELNLYIEVDLIEAISNQLDIEGSETELINAVRALPFNQVIGAIEAARTSINEQTHAYLDGAELALGELVSDHPRRIYDLLRLNPETTIYRTTFSSRSTFDEGRELQFQFPELLGTVSLYISSPGQTLVEPGKKSSGYRMEAGGIYGFSNGVATALNYIHHGFRHVIPLGLDHILFVAALCLLSIRLSTLIWQISVFTLAHTISLGLSSAGVVSVSGDIVEPLIAVSIAWVAIENLVVKRLHRWRLLIVFLFGLLHGLGFATALKELGLPATHWLTSLISFNVGVELGQLAVVALTLLAVYWFREKIWYTKFVQTPLCLAIAAMGLFWAIQRVI